MEPAKMGWINKKINPVKLSSYFGTFCKGKEKIALWVDFQLQYYYMWLSAALANYYFPALGIVYNAGM